RADCLSVLPAIESESVDLVFADPPFNLNKHYGPGVVDDRPDYLTWCHRWLRECCRSLRDGGSLFVYNLPRWNVALGYYLERMGLTFRHWIAVENTNCLPIPGRLYPSHYSLIYYSKGQPSTFRRIRTPIETCRHCGGEIKDYGGHRSAMNPDGVSLKDVWTDIPPVRHWKFKPSGRKSNSLSTKLLERVIEMSTEPGDLVLDPFGGSGTTYAVCEQRGRRWIGVEIEDAGAIRDRLNGHVVNHANTDVVCPS
ncbi:MAG: site-specific DNA-methyltransferase, partial [Rhodococcus sp.]|nr:site-specific DNA-methyltransferase [Rhodococcus sp. (in: high G+C Gram-positive bacteria)]